MLQNWNISGREFLVRGKVMKLEEHVKGKNWKLG